MERLEQAVRAILQSANAIERWLAWVRGSGDKIIDPETKQYIADSANDIQTQVEKILKEIQK